MALTSGTRLGPYEIVSPLGAGGMGEVYRARDTRLDREVAVKVLPANLSSDPNLRQRLEREAKAVSRLSHAHICTLHDIGHQDGVDFLVMEYLEGVTLEHRLNRGPLPPEQTVCYAVQIADALAKAHKLGITHRDLKPSNIMLTKSGAKLMDFGLAKQTPLAAALTEMTMEQLKLTSEGMLVGTMQYMAPEQLEGKDADARTDIFALGAVIYEMATGRKAFEGKSHASLIAAILEREPQPISTLQTMAPPALDHVVRTCLAKDPEARWQTAHDVLVELKWLMEAGSQAAMPKPVVERRRRRDVLLSLLAASVSSIAFLILAFVHFRERPREVEAIRFQFPIPDKVTLSGADFPVVSPDGRRIVISGRTPEGTSLLWIHSLDSLATQSFAGTEDASMPCWSPDSRFVAFFTGLSGAASAKLKKIDISGGPAQTICDLPSGVANTGTWNQDGLILFGNNANPLFRVSADGGPSQP